MLWFRKGAKQRAEAERDLIVPAPLPTPLDPALFAQHFESLLASVERVGGVEIVLDSLEAKHRLFAGALRRERPSELSLADVETLLDTVFTARRRLFPALEEAGAGAVRSALTGLIYGDEGLSERLARFAERLVPDGGEGAADRKAAAKVRRAAHDFGSEALHYRDPVRYPLMARWVWDQATVSGALREFIRGGDQLTDVPLGSSPETFEGARQWLAEMIAAQGIYQHVHFWIDLVQAQAYVTYFRSMAEGGLGGDFGRGSRPEEQLRKLLGIDVREDGRSRVKKLLEAN
jgi:hypothetical protein